MHSAKGLEFKHVYIVGMEDTLFPSPMSTGSARELEEERRLFYVALTRAEKQATLSYALNRYKWGNLEHCSPSRFLREVDQKFLQYPQTGGKPFPKNNMPAASPKPVREEPVKQMKPDGRFRKMTKIEAGPVTTSPQSVASSGQYTEGDTVEHERFGKGVIVAIEGKAPDTTATVEFDREGSKKLLLRFAKLKKL